VQTPAPLGYNDFLIGSDPTKVNQSDLLTATAESFTSSKTTVEGLLTNQQINFKFTSISEEELRSLAKVCVGNSVYLMKLTREVSDGGSASGEVEFDFDTNAEFCIVKLI